ncbi:hypothetical protein [Sphingomonas sp.]|jgi:hypothetical protein
MEDVMRLIVTAVLAAMLMGLAERTTLDERGLRIAAVPSATAAV